MKYLYLYITSFIEVLVSLEFFGVFFKKRIFFRKSKFRILPIFLFSSFSIFGLNLLGLTPVNIISCTFFCYLACAIIYKIAIIPSIIYITIIVLMNSGMEFLLSLIMLNEYYWLSTDLTAQANYELIFSGPLPVVVLSIMIYIPVLITKHIFKKSRVKMNNITFLMYILIPIINIITILCLPLLDPDISENPFVRNIFTVYIFSILIASYLLFYVFQRHQEEFQKKNDLLKESFKNQHEKDLLEVSAKALKSRLGLVENAMENEKVLRHDRRHFENTIYSLLQNGDEQSINQAKILLQEKINAEPKRLRKWCENETVNATMEYYISLAEKNEIPVDVDLSVPKEIRVESLKLSIALGNLLENAIHANQKIDLDKRFLKVKSICKKQLLFQIENACPENVKLNSENIPTTDELGHGTGTKSVIAFATQTNSEVLYSIVDGTFVVQMII